MTTKLTTADQSDIKIVNHELANIERSFKTIGPAVTRIHARGNWKAVSKTWQEFCEQQGWSRQRMHQIETGWKAVLSLPPAMSTTVDTERAAREIAKAPEKAREHVVESILERGEKVTSETVKKALLVLDVKPQDRKPSDKKTWPKDCTGYLIPPPAWPFWDRRNEVQPDLNQLSEMKCRIQKAKESGDALYSWIGSPAIDALQNAYVTISNAKLYAACTKCQGWWDRMTGGGCATCHNTGMISKHQYDVCSPAEIKAMREKGNRVVA